MRRTIGYLVIALLAGCLAPSTVASAQAPSTIAIQDNQFNPAQVTTSSGATLIWSNAGGDQHTVTADDGSFDSGPLNPGDAFTLPAPAPGTYPYYCQIHGGPGGQGMAGTLVVGG
ncbi:MAG TPA: cupredoxin domain-containing protein [Chloroflexota bacterium]|nr:cupredoxin domain-containing protein [Chloroflexota bacterium]